MQAAIAASGTVAGCQQRAVSVLKEAATEKVCHVAANGSSESKNTGTASYMSVLLAELLIVGN